MADLENLARWHATMDMAVHKFEQKTGLRLAGLPPSEVAKRITGWVNAKTSPSNKAHVTNDRRFGSQIDDITNNKSPD